MKHLRKYVLTDESITIDGHTLYRIKALYDFDICGYNHVRKGDLGGFVEGYFNLSQHGKCWIYDDAKVYLDAKVKDNAKILNNAEISTHEEISGNAQVSGNAKILFAATVRDNAQVSDNAIIRDNADISGNSLVCGHSVIKDDAKVTDNTLISGYTMIGYYSKVCHNAQVSGNAIIDGHANICGYANISGDITIKESGDYLTFMDTFDGNFFITWTKPDNMWKVGQFFYGTSEELIKWGYGISKERGNNYRALVDYVNKINVLNN